MTQRLMVVLALVTGAALAPLPAAAQVPGQQPAAALSPAAQARADSLARAALAATAAGERLLVDVRTPEEFQAGHLRGALNLPLADLPQRWTELKAYPQRHIVVYCRSGIRAGVALELLAKNGIRNAVNGGGYESLRQRLEGTAK